MSSGLSRRGLLAAGGVALGLGATSWGASSGEAKAGGGFRYCLNTSTISGQRLSLAAEIDLIAKAGYDAVEPWVREVEGYVRSGGSLADLKTRIGDAGLSVENAIGFARWIVDDEAERAKGLEQAKREMEMLAQIGCKRVAAPPSGANDKPGLDLLKAAGRYKALAELAGQFGIVPQVEIWGSSKVLSRLGEAMLVAAESGFAGACVLPDVYHMYKSGSAYESLRLLSPQAVQMIHMNDYPADPPRATINDSHRVYPGDGIAPLGTILRDLRQVNANCVLSLELFNREYYKQDALTVARTGLEKMKAAVAKSQG